jgi:hypothetical protein
MGLDGPETEKKEKIDLIHAIRTPVSTKLGRDF